MLVHFICFSFSRIVYKFSLYSSLFFRRKNSFLTQNSGKFRKFPYICLHEWVNEWMNEWSVIGRNLGRKEWKRKVGKVKAIIIERVLYLVLRFWWLKFGDQIIRHEDTLNCNAITISGQTWLTCKWPASRRQEEEDDDDSCQRKKKNKRRHRSRGQNTEHNSIFSEKAIFVSEKKNEQKRRQFELSV